MPRLAQRDGQPFGGRAQLVLPAARGGVVAVEIAERDELLEQLGVLALRALELGSGERQHRLARTAGRGVEGRGG